MPQYISNLTNKWNSSLRRKSGGSYLFHAFQTNKIPHSFPRGDGPEKLLLRFLAIIDAAKKDGMDGGAKMWMSGLSGFFGVEAKLNPVFFKSWEYLV